MFDFFKFGRNKPTQELRGVWIANLPHSEVLSSNNNINRALDFLEKMRFNVVFPVVWNRGYTLYPSEVMRQLGVDSIYPDFRGRDPLAEVITAAHNRGIAVIPWFEYGFTCAAPDGGHILAQKPQFAGCDRHGSILNQGGVTWMNALNPQVQQFMIDLVLEVVNNYKVEGIQGDDRFPAFPVAGFDQRTAHLFQDKFYRLPQVDNDRQWIKFRSDILTLFWANLYYQVKAINHNLIVAVAPSVYPFCYEHFLQDYPTWVKQGLVDLICPQVYREYFNGTGMYRDEVNKITQTFSSRERAKFAPAIAFKAHNKEVDLSNLMQYIQLNRRSGFQGQVFFHYEGLRKHSDAIATALRQTVYADVATLPPPFAIV